jgi:preprotein translocase subunit SecG
MAMDDDGVMCRVMMMMAILMMVIMIGLMVMHGDDNDE